MNTQDIRFLLDENGVRPTRQRIAVYKFLACHPIHPTAETIYHELQKTHSNFSRATVYNSLNKLAEVGLIKVLTIDPDEQRFDGTIRDHGHFRCTRCGQVFDFPVDFEAALSALPNDAQLYSRELFCTGVCANCCARS